MKKKSLIFIFLVLAIGLYFINPSEKSLKEGDIVFQISKSKQSPLVQYSTLSPWSHCGVIVERNNQKYVLEASSRVKLTPLKEWINRGRFNRFKSRRIIRNKEVKINYNRYLNRSYDLSFKFNNGRYYCSELVYLIYKDQFNIEIAKPKKVKRYNIFFLKDILIKRNIDLNQLVIAPKDLL